MTIHVVAEMLNEAPNLKGLVKSASDLEALQGFPTSSKELSTLSLAKIEYMEKVANLEVDPLAKAHVIRACALYGIKDSGLPTELTTPLMKQASIQAHEAELKATVMRMEDLRTHRQFDQLVKVARTLDGQFEDLDHRFLNQFTGKGTLDKKACLEALNKRFVMTKDEDFTKVASVLEKKDFSTLNQGDKQMILDTIYGLDKKAGLSQKGWCIYEETILEKKAESINLGKGKQVPIERVLDILPALQDALGKDVVKEIQAAEKNGSAQAVIDSLPMDLKGIISRYV